MTLSDSELEFLVPELAARLVGQRLTSAWQPARDRVVLGFQDGTRLLLCPRGPDARLHTINRRPTNPQKPFSFQGACRAHLSGPLTAMTKEAGDRVVDLVFGESRLHLRLTGRSGGLWLLKGDEVVAAYDGPAPAELPERPPHEPREIPPRFTGDPSWDAEIGRFYALLVRERRERELRIEVARLLRRKAQRLATLLQNLEGDLEKADAADSVRACADTLAAHLHTITQGADHVDLPSLEDPDTTLRVPLQPDRAPSRSLEALYAKARRLERMGERVLERIEAVERELREVQSVREALDDAELEALEALKARHGQSDADRPRGRALPGVTTWTGPRGEEVLVGRDAKANRRLTFQIAKGADYWMHVRGAPGAHLILPMRRGQTPPLELLLAAGQIAAVHAGIPVGAKVDVQYTRVRDIRSIPGTEAEVRVHNEKVLHITRDPADLAGWDRA
ncbi:MAG: NFACT family protein [Alphaproteobacteria bacterium]|nr:NFACT family protein [Alphaproteobacteria bacterium]